MIRLGLTGGVGMGKSTASHFLYDLGFKVADTDDIARTLVEPGKPALEDIVKAFGKSDLGFFFEISLNSFLFSIILFFHS